MLHSYYKGFDWSDGIDQGIGETLKQSPEKLSIYTEYMDSKRFPDPQQILDLYILYSTKYAHIHFDVIICVDDNAFQFLLKHRDRLFPTSPVVFCGVNDFSQTMLEGHEGFTGVLETINPRKTLEAALLLQPDTRDVAVVVDRTPTGMGTAKEIQRISSSFASQINFTFFDDLDMSELLRRVGNLSKGSIVLLMNFNRDKSGNSFSHREAIELLHSVSEVPIYGIWNVIVGEGILGGMITSNIDQGKMAAHLALCILNGESIQNMPVISKIPQELVFDYKEMKRFGIGINKLPKGSVLINGPKTFYQINKKLLWSLGALLIFLSLTISVLVLNIMQRKRAQKTLSKVYRALLSLNQCNQAMMKAKTESGLATEICRIIVEVGGYHQAWVCYAENEDCISLKSISRFSKSQTIQSIIRSDSNMRLSIKRSIAKALRKGKPFILRHGESLESKDISQKPEIKSFDNSVDIILPLKFEKVVAGVLNISTSVADAFDEEEIDLLTKLSENLSYGIMMQRLAVQRQKAEKELMLSNVKLSMLLESLPIVPFACDPDEKNTITYVSQVIEKITGYPGSAFTEDTGFWISRIHPKNRDYLTNLLDMFDSDGKLNCKYQFQCSDGSYRWFNDIRHIVHYPTEGISMIVGTWQDITKEEILQQESELRLRQLIQADKLASLGEVVAGIAHEINNPNSFISYNIPLLQETWRLCLPMIEEYLHHHPEWRFNGMTGHELFQDMDDILKDIDTGSQRINRVVSHLKEYTRIDDAHMGHKIQINEVVKKALNIVESQIRKSFVEYTVSLAPTLPMILGHFTKLEQVVTNLVVNATQAVPPDSQCNLSIRTERLKELDCLAIHVEDSGIGIDPEIGYRIFDAFFTTRNAQGGTGLGLSVSNNLIKEHNGSLCFVSRRGVGTRFTVFLPLNRERTLDIRPSALWVGGDEKWIGQMRSASKRPPGMFNFFSLMQEDQVCDFIDSHPQISIVVIDMTQLDREEGWRVVQQIAHRHPLITRIIYSNENGLMANHSIKAFGPDHCLVPPFKEVLNHRIFQIMESPLT